MDATSENVEKQLFYWFFLCDNRARQGNGRTEFEFVSDSLLGIHVERPDLFPKEAIIIPESAIKCVSTESKMRKAAEYLRSKVHFPFCIYGFKEAPSFHQKYLHTFGGEFYKWNEHGWKKDQLGTAKDSLGVDEGTIISLVPPCSVSNTTAAALPSQVFDEEFVYFPSSEEAIAKMRQGKGGKWMVHSPGCMNMHDSYWQALVNLCQIGLFVGVKASTARIKESTAIPGDFRRADPVIMCYTADSGDKVQVGRAADAIREVVKCDLVLYYKTNSASNSGRYYHEGSRNVSRYMHTVERELYERDKMKRMRWVEYQNHRVIVIVNPW